MGWPWCDGDVCGGVGGEGDVLWVEVVIYSWNYLVKSPTHIHTHLHTHTFQEITYSKK